MANKEYKLTRPDDGRDFTLMLNEEDRQTYEDARWEPKATNRKNPVTGKDLSAKARAPRGNTVKDAADEAGVTITE